MKRGLFATCGLGVAAVLFACTVSSVMAKNTQPATGKQGQVQSQEVRHVQALARLKAAMAKLDLTAEQKAKIDGIMADTRAKLHALRAQAKDGSREQLREKVGAIMKDTRAQIASVLTPEQKAKWKEMREQFREKHQGKQAQQGKPNV